MFTNSANALILNTHLVDNQYIYHDNYALKFYHSTNHNFNSYKYCCLALVATFSIIFACFFQPLHDYSHLSVGNRVIKIENDIYETPLEISIDENDFDLSHVKDTMVIAITPYSQLLHYSQLKHITDVLIRVSKHHPTLFLSSKSIKKNYQQLIQKFALDF